MAGQKENPVITGDMKNNVDRASILIESLPYIRKMRGQTFVIKYGGNAMINEDLKQSVMDDITLLKYIGINPVIVHGGGPDISDMLNKVTKRSSSIPNKCIWTRLYDGISKLFNFKTIRRIRYRN